MRRVIAIVVLLLVAALLVNTVRKMDKATKALELQNEQCTAQLDKAAEFVANTDITDAAADDWLRENGLYRSDTVQVSP